MRRITCVVAILLAAGPAALVAQADRIRTYLGWQPENDDLETIVCQALEWGARARLTGVEQCSRD